MSIRWQVGVTTTMERVNTLLPQTLESLLHAGFMTSRHSVRLFIDSAVYHDVDLRIGNLKLEHQITNHDYKIGPYGNWLLALLELYIRHPQADRFMIVQDDVKFYPHLREYLDSLPMPEKGYWNLFTAQVLNEDLVWCKKVGFMESACLNPENPAHVKSTFQCGKGALALVFSREGVIHLLSQRHLYERIQDEKNGWRSIDGAVVHAMNLSGWREYIHNPTLVQHCGDESTIYHVDENGEKVRKKHPRAITWRGDTFDASKLLEENPLTSESL